VFWKTTLAEYMALVKGWNRAQGGGVDPMTRERFEELDREYGGPSKSIKQQKLKS